MNIIEAPKKIEILDEADVCILGGGTTGVMAAVRAARLGARVIIVEQQGNFGGNGTSGLVSVWHSLKDFNFDKQIISGLSEEILDRLRIRGALSVSDPDSPGHASRMSRISTYMFNAQELKIELDGLLQESGVIMYLHTFFSAPYIHDGKLKAVIVESKNGRQAIRAKFFIDATGDGDLCRRLGIEAREYPDKQPSTTAAVLYGYDGIEKPRQVLREHLSEYGLPDLGWDTGYVGAPGVSLLCKSNVFFSCLDAKELTKSELEGRRQVRAMMEILQKHGNPSKPIALLNLSSHIGIREGRSIKCAYTLTGEDICGGRKFDDAIANGSYPIDIHHTDKPGCTFWYLNGMTEYERDGYPHEISWWKEPSDNYPAYWQIPYRSMVVREYDNLLVCGRAMDADRRAFGAIRVMINLNQTGEAAGVAAWVSISSGKGNDSIDTGQLHKLLADGGSIVLGPEKVSV
jgi:hypothetical protein